jgi:hypothetical protein
VPNIYELLKEKEAAVERVHREVEALRLACHLLHDEGDTPNAFTPGIEEENTDGGPLSDPGILDRGQKGIEERSGRSLILQLTQFALGASRTFWKRVLESRLLEREPQRNAIRDLFERLGRTNAA